VEDRGQGWDQTPAKGVDLFPSTCLLEFQEVQYQNLVIQSVNFSVQIA
jgi:hypothetical protein